MKTAEYIIPESYLCALINGDTSGLSDEDDSALDRFIDDRLKEYPRFHCLSDTRDEGFMKYHDLEPYGVLACDCVTVAFDIGD